MERNNIFADNLRHFIKDKGLTQQYVADELGVAKGTISDWLHGRCFPRHERIEKLAKILHVQKADLIEERNDNSDYFLNKEVQKMAQEMYDNPDARALFSASRKLSKEDLQGVKKLIERLTRES